MPLITWVGKRFKKFPSRVAVIQSRLARHTVVAMTGVRLMPGALVPCSIAAGLICFRYLDFVLGITAASLIDDGTTILSGLATRLSIEYLGVEPTPWLFGVGVIVMMVLVWFVPWIFFGRKQQQKDEAEAIKNPAAVSCVVKK